MAIKITENPQWHEFQPGIELLINPVTRSDMRKMVTDANGDQEKLAELMADHTLLGWQGLATDDGSDLPVTIENKKVVMNNIILAQFIDEKSTGLLAAEEKEEKN